MQHDIGDLLARRSDGVPARVVERSDGRYTLSLVSGQVIEVSASGLLSDYDELEDGSSLDALILAYTQEHGSATLDDNRDHTMRSPLKTTTALAFAFEGASMRVPSR